MSGLVTYKRDDSISPTLHGIGDILEPLKRMGQLCYHSENGGGIAFKQKLILKTTLGAEAEVTLSEKNGL